MAMTVTLDGLSKRGRERVAMHGSRWAVEAEREATIFGGPGPWLLVHPEDNPTPLRWVRRHDDPDFRVTEEHP